MKQFTDWLRENTDGQISAESIADYLHHLRNKGYKANTYNVKLSAVKGSVRFMLDDCVDEITQLQRWEVERFLNSLRQMKRQNSAVPRERMLTYDEIESLKQAAPPRMQLVITFLAHTGVRISELIQIRLADIREEATHFQIRIIGKGDKERYVKVNKNLVNEIQQRFNGSEYLFETHAWKNGRKGGKPLHRVNVAKDVSRLSQRVLGKHASPHTLRHSFATYMIENGNPIKSVADYLGHSSVQTTLDLYVHCQQPSIDQLPAV